MTDNATKYFGNPAFREYVFLLVELERLFRHGRGESAEADAIREEMDFPMHRYDAAELDALKEFGKHLTAMSKKYGRILDQEPTNSATANNGAPQGRTALPSGAPTELSK
jgi:hypothetical protein